jgi:hypothetical protein
MQEIFHAQIASLSRAGYLGIAPDFPGHGQSGNAMSPRATYSFTGYFLRGHLMQLGIRKCHIVGLSLGATHQSRTLVQICRGAFTFDNRCTTDLPLPAGRFAGICRIRCDESRWSTHIWATGIADPAIIIEAPAAKQRPRYGGVFLFVELS